MPVYNTEDYISKGLDSLINQTYTNIEILCIDDCSTDNSANIIKDYLNRDSRIKLFSTPQKSSPSAARNIGLANANGEYLMFCDSDDTYEETMCETMLKTIIEKDVELVTCKANIENEIIDKGLELCINSNPEGKYILKNELKQSINVFLWNKIFKKSIVDKYKIKFPDVFIAEDNAFTMKYVSVIKNYFGLEDCLYNYIIRKKSLTQSLAKEKAGKRKFDKLKVIEDFYDFLVKYNLFKEEEIYFKLRINAELFYMLRFNKYIDRVRTVKLYNEFVKKADLLDYEEYQFKNIYLKPNHKTNLFCFISLLRKSYWF